MKLFRSDSLVGSWVGEDPSGSLVQWPAKPRGYADRTPYLGTRRDRRELVEVDPRLATRTGWPGVPRGPAPHRGPSATYQLAIRLTADERAAWQQAAGKRPVAQWARALVNQAAGVA